MDPANLTNVPPPLPPNPDITPVELYNLSDHEALSYAPERLVEAALAVWTSPVYGHFHVGCRHVMAPHPVTGVPTFKHFEFTFTCRFDPDRCKMRTRKRKSTGSYGTKNLKDAVNRCNRRRGVTNNPAPAPVPFTDIRFRAYLLIWCAVSRQPFNVLRDPILRELFDYAHPGIVIPRPPTLSRALTCMFNQAMIDAGERFQDIDTAIHLAIDGWTSPLSASFLGIIVIWYEGATVWRSVLDFIHLTESHSGEYLAEETIKCLTRFRVVNQIETICLDNASNNNTFVQNIAPSLPNFAGPQSRTNCAAHVNNLIARAFMSPCNRPSSKRRRTATNARITAPRTDTNNQHPNTSSLASPEGSSSTSSDPEVVIEELDGAPPTLAEVDEGRELHDSEVVQKSVLDAINAMRPRGVIMSTEEAKEARDLFPKVNAFVTHLHKSPTDYAAFSEVRKRHQDSVHSNVEIPSAVNTTRWDSELRCAKTYRALRTPIEVMLSDTKYRSLHKFRLTPRQWDLLDMMYECLQAPGNGNITTELPQLTPTISHR
ncbi:hypothetical protein RhiJN_24489 [Ceratobasidium sp. AG-Ba]|nr:hypothetical protein RhiJN_24489 [Ceratobasidium sp. AG-Ba]